MTPLILLDELRAYLTQAVANCRLDTKAHRLAAPQTHAGYLPEEEDTQRSTCPYIIVRLLGTEDLDDESTAKVKILLCARAEDVDFWRDVVNMGERIRQALLQQRCLAKQFRLKLPLIMECPEEQPYPEAIAWFTSHWIIPQPQPKLEEGIYGERIGWR